MKACGDIPKYGYYFEEITSFALEVRSMKINAAMDALRSDKTASFIKCYPEEIRDYLTGETLHVSVAGRKN